MDNKGLEKKFNEDKALINFLMEKLPSVTRNMVGKYFFKKHCGERMLKIKEIEHKIHKNGRLELRDENAPVNPIAYCIRCGYYKVQYGD